MRARWSRSYDSPRRGARDQSCRQTTANSVNRRGRTTPMRAVKDWKELTLLASLCAVVWAFAVTNAGAQPSTPPSSCGKAGDVDLDQNWDAQQKRRFWFDSQGSRIMPYSWFIALEQAASEALLIDSCYMESFGFIVVPGHKLPIGFARDQNRTNTATYIGLTCAACHTARLTFGNRTALVEGGPGMADFSAF